MELKIGKGFWILPKNTILLYLKILIFSFFFAISAFPAEITCTANKVIATLNKNKTIKKIIFEGNVVFTYKNIKILTDKAVVDPVQHTIYIKGIAHFIRKSVKVKARGISYNYKKNTGTFKNVYFSYIPIYGRAEKVVKKGNTYILYNGYVTTCPRKPEPVYRVQSKKIMISSKTKKITARNIKIYIGNIPVFYFPVFSQSITAKKPFIEIRPGYQTEIGKTMDIIFNNSSYNINSSEKLNLGTSATEAGWSLENDKNKNQRLDAYLIKKYSENSLLYGIFGQFQQNFSKGNNVIFDWRDVRDETTFQDYFYSQFIKKSENPNYFYYTKTFPGSIFDFGIQDHAGESLLFPDRFPDINYTKPFFNAGNLLAGFNSSWTRFSNLSYPVTDRAYNSISLEEPFNVSYGKISPFLQLTDIYYHNQSTNMDNFVPKIGIKTDMLFKRVDGRYTDFLSPAFSFYSQYPSEKTVPFNFDLLDYNPSASFLGADVSWSRWKENKNIANVLVQNSYNINTNKFQDSIESYNFSLSKEIGISGQQLFNFSDGGMTENINTLSFKKSSSYTFSIGNEFDKGYINAISAGMTRKIGSKWKFNANIYYDLNGSSLNEWSFNIEKKVKCFVVGLTVIRSNVTSVYFTIIPAAFSKF
ncbi:MAG: hypothetical protein M1409_01445 [Actinobacteria bacterium]|nr:hypothetical protein [Actinomycetota bacterium]MCL5408805.1 hypothetical protein [Candidatus Omnitrophota bacterium]